MIRSVTLLPKITTSQDILKGAMRDGYFKSNSFLFVHGESLHFQNFVSIMIQDKSYISQTNYSVNIKYDTKVIKMDYIDRMIATRQDNDETQDQLSKNLGWSRPQIARYEIRSSTPNIEYLIAFCRHYRVSADYILGLPKGLKHPR